MANSYENIIKEIAENMDFGADVYYNPKTKEVVSIPNTLDVFGEEEFDELFNEDLEKIAEHENDFIKFEAVKSGVSFKIMERFVEQMTDVVFQSQLESRLYNKKPFQGFKNAIDNSDYRQSWFDFKQSELEKIVADRLEEENPGSITNDSK